MQRHLCRAPAPGPGVPALCIFMMAVKRSAVVTPAAAQLSHLRVSSQSPLAPLSVSFQSQSFNPDPYARRPWLTQL